jgi:hypothetical protein
MWPAGAPATTREARVLQTTAVSSLGEDLGRGAIEAAQ